MPFFFQVQPYQEKMRAPYVEASENQDILGTVGTQIPIIVMFLPILILFHKKSELVLDKVRIPQCN